MAGFPAGSSGRQQDLSSLAAMKRYDTVIENTEHEWAKAFELAWRMMRDVPGLRPDGIGKRDLEAEIQVEVKLRAQDPIESDRVATLGSRLFQQGEIDIRTNLIKYQGYSEIEAEDIIANILVDKLTLYNPDVATVMGMVFAEESGMEKWLQMAQERRMMMEGQQKGLAEMPSPTEQQRGAGEVQTQLGREQAPQAMVGARASPERWTR